MSLLAITNVEVLNPTTPFQELMQFKISINCLQHLPGELEWNLIWVGSSDSSEYDQIVDSVSVGPIPPGNHEFEFYAENPIDPTRIREGELVGPTVVLINACYNQQEFVRVGYYVNVFYDNQEMQENPPAVVQLDKLVKEILHTEPRVTRFKINWTENGEKYSISDQAIESNGNNVAAGVSDDVLMTGNDAPSARNLVEASQNSILADRMHHLLADMADAGGSNNGNGNGQNQENQAPASISSSGYQSATSKMVSEMESTSMDAQTA